MRFYVLAALCVAACLSQAAKAASPFADCTTTAFANDAARDAAFKCSVVREVTFQVQDQQAYVRTLRDTVDDRSEQYEPTVLEAAEHGFNMFSGIRSLRLGRVTFVFQLAVKGMDAQAYAFAHPLGGVSANAECIIRVNTARHDAGSGDVLNELKNTIVHELFHCVQYWNWPAKMNEAFKLDARWWIEGTAELMGHAAFESSVSRDKRIKEFHDQIQKVPLTKIEYPNLVFFSWVWAKKPSRVFDLIDAMPETAGEALQRAALVKFIGDYDLGIFVTDYVDGKIRTPDNAPVSPAPYAEKRTISDAGESAFELEPLTVHVEDVTFTGGQYLSTGKGKATMAYRRQTGVPDEWRSASFVSADGPCNQPKVFRFAGMAMGAGGPGPESWSLDVTKISGCETCAAPPQRDKCVQGQWRISNDSLRAAVAAYLGESVEAVEVSGFAGMNARADGTHSFVFASFKVDGKPADSGDAIAFRIALAGFIDSTWGAANGHLGLCYQGSDAKMQTAVPGGLSDPIDFAEAAAMSGKSGQNYDYQCPSADRLVLFMIADDKTIPIEFERIGE